MCRDVAVVLSQQGAGCCWKPALGRDQAELQLHSCIIPPGAAHRGEKTLVFSSDPFCCSPLGRNHKAWRAVQSPGAVGWQQQCPSWIWAPGLEQRTSLPQQGRTGLRGSAQPQRAAAKGWGSVPASPDPHRLSLLLPQKSGSTLPGGQSVKMFFPMRSRVSTNLRLAAHLVCKSIRTPQFALYIYKVIIIRKSKKKKSFSMYLFKVYFFSFLYFPECKLILESPGEIQPHLRQSQPQLHARAGPAQRNPFAPTAHLYLISSSLGSLAVLRSTFSFIQTAF